MKKIAIYCPFYITAVNEGCWVIQWINNIKKYEYCDIYYSISYPIESKWDKSNTDKAYTPSKELIDNISNQIPSEYKLLFNSPNIEHSEALGYAHSILLQLGYDYMVHIEQDVTLFTNITDELVNTCERYKKTVLITDITCRENIDIDISIFCIHLPSYQHPCYNQSYYDDTNQFIPKINPYALYGVYPAFHPLLSQYTHNQIKDAYIQILDELDPLLHKRNKIFLNSNPFNMEYVQNPMLIDVARAFVIRSKLNDSLFIYKKIKASHNQQSRVKTLKIDKLYDIKSTSRIAIYCPFYITDNSSLKWVESWKSNVLKYITEYDIYYSISYPSNPDKWDVIYDKVDIPNTPPSISLDNCTMLFNEPNIEHSNALYRMHKFAESKYDYFIHIEQDVLLNYNIVPELISNMINGDHSITITNTIPNRGASFSDIDMSVFCINIKKIHSEPNLYDPILCDINYNVNLFNFNDIKFNKNIKDNYKDALHHIFRSDVNYTEYNKWLQTNPFNNNIIEANKWKSDHIEYKNNSIEIGNPIYLDMGRKLIVDNFTSNELAVIDNTNNKLFTHIGHSRFASPECINNIKTCNLNCNTCNLKSNHNKLSVIDDCTIYNTPLQADNISDIKSTHRIAIYCPFYITDNSNLKWVESWKSNVLKYITEYDIYYSISYPTNPAKWDVVHDKVNILTKAPDITLDNCTMLFNEPNIEHSIALYRMHKFTESKYDYLIHIEQDVLLNYNIIPELIHTLEKNDTNIIIANTTPQIHNELIDFDVSVFAINLNKIKSNSDLYNPILCDLMHKINIFDLHEVAFNEDVKSQYKQLLYTLFNNNDIYNSYENYIHTNAFNDSIQHAKKMKSLYSEHNDKKVEIINPIYFDMGRKLIFDNFISDKLSIIDNIDNKLFTHIGHSRYTSPIQSLNTNQSETSKKHYPKQYKKIDINNSTPSKSYAIYCPFYITSNNEAYWINNWINNVANNETAPIYYSISYASDVDIIVYDNVINKLNKIGICIFSEANITHPIALKRAHDYLSTEYDYMIHIEQDVILRSPICNHIINSMIDNNTDITITDIESNILFETPSDIDISIFAINLTAYNSNSYNTYFNSDDLTPTVVDKLFNVLDESFNNKPPILANTLDNLNIHTSIEKILNSIYTNSTYWFTNTNDKLEWNFIDTLSNPVLIDTARAYILHAYESNKLNIINGIQKYAKHLKQSRYKATKNSMDIKNITSIFGYPPHGYKSTYNINNIDIVIISQNQCESLLRMVTELKFQLPDSNRIFVLDRCSDNSASMLSDMHEFYIERHDATGFCAGTARNLGLQYTNPTHDVLFLDGDRIPRNISMERLLQMLYYFDVSLIKNEVDIRNWFSDIPQSNPMFGRYDNGVWSSALLLRRSAINSIKQFNNFDGIFNPIFDGAWGEEDEYLGDVCNYLNMKCGGFPNFIYVEGDTTIADQTLPTYKTQTEKRILLRNELDIYKINNKEYDNKITRRMKIEHFIKHRNRNEN